MDKNIHYNKTNISLKGQPFRYYVVCPFHSSINEEYNPRLSKRGKYTYNDSYVSIIWFIIKLLSIF